MFFCSAYPNSIQNYIKHIMYINKYESSSHLKNYCINEFRIISLKSFSAACSPSWHSWVSAEYTHQGKSSSLARNDAVIGISTNNTRIHHSHGNITQTSRVRAWRVYSGTKKFNLNYNLLLFLITLHAQRTLLFPGCKASFHANHHVSPKSKSFVLLHHELARKPGYLILSILLTA